MFKDPSLNLASILCAVCLFGTLCGLIAFLVTNAPGNRLKYPGNRKLKACTKKPELKEPEVEEFEAAFRK